MSLLDELTDTVAFVAQRVGPSVVGVRGRGARGSGFVVGPDRVLTSAHNTGRSESLTIVFADGRHATGAVRGVDVDGDLAVVEADTAGVAQARWAAVTETRGLGLGTHVFALANPGGHGLRVTPGTVSAVEVALRGPTGRSWPALEHTAPLPRGSSGGPVVDAHGRVVGVNTDRVGKGFYLALPADERLQHLAGALARGESPDRPRLGVTLESLERSRRLRAATGLPETDGLLIRGVVADAPAGRAGVRKGDLLVRLGERAVTSADDVSAALADLTPPADVVLALMRGTEELTVTVRFGQAPVEGTA